MTGRSAVCARLRAHGQPTVAPSPSHCTRPDAYATRCLRGQRRTPALSTKLWNRVHAVSRSGCRAHHPWAEGADTQNTVASYTLLNLRSVTTSPSEQSGKSQHSVVHGPQEADVYYHDGGDRTTPAPPRGDRGDRPRSPGLPHKPRHPAQLNGGASADEYIAPIFVFPALIAGPAPMTRKIQLLFGERMFASVTL